MISKFFIHRPRFAFVISIVITLVGLIAIFNLPVAQFPNITPPQVTVSASYTGANADTILNTVIQPIESQVNGVKKMIYMSSQAANDGSATITVTFALGSDGDLNTVNTQNRVSVASSQLPDEVIRQGVTTMEKSSNMLLIINVFSPQGTYDGVFLSNFTLINLRDAMLRINGVGDASILGPMDYSIRIWLDPDRLTSMGLTADNVMAAVKEQNVQVAAGQVGAAPADKNQQFQYTIQTQGRLADVKQFEDIIVRANPDGSAVTVKDVAKVSLGSYNYASFGELNNKPSALLAVYQLPEANGLQVAQQVKAELDNLAKTFPKDLKTSILYDTTRFVQKSIAEVVTTLFEAALLVILVVFIFLQDWRSTLVPTIAIPVSLIGTFAFMLAMGFTINTISLFGLILAIGIVVDDAIIVIENVHRIMDQEGLSPVAAAEKTMEQVTSPVISTTLVLMSVFVPVCFMPGITGELYRQFAVTISISVLISSLNALTLSPALCACILKPGTAHSKRWAPFRWFNSFFDVTTNGYLGCVSFALKRAVIVIGIMAAVFGVCYFIYGKLPTGFIPNEDQGAFFVDVRLPDCAAQPRTHAAMQKVCEIIKQTPGVTDVMSVVGFSMLSNANSPNTGLIVVVLDDWDKRKTPALALDAIMESVQAKLFALPEASYFAFSIPAIPGLGSTSGFSFVLQDKRGGSPQQLAEVAQAVIYNANQRPEIQQAYTTFRANIPQLYLEIDREKVKKMGVALSDVFSTLQAQLGSYYINNFNKFGKVYKVMIQADEQFRASEADISKLYVKNNNGQMVPLNTFMTIKTIFGPENLGRYNMFSSVNIYGSAAPGYSSGQAMKAMEESAAKTLPEGYGYDWTDMSYQERLAGNQVMIIFIMALTFIYLFLVAQYESWLIPISVMLSAPVAFLGALLGLYIAGIENNIYAQVGFVLLFGLACKTAILMVEFAKEEHEKGASVLDAAQTAARIRFRAVIMTAVAFVLGVLPLVLAAGPGAVSRRCLGTVIFAGMIFAAVVATLLIPSFFAIIQSMIDWSKGKPAAAGPQIKNDELKIKN